MRWLETDPNPEVTRTVLFETLLGHCVLAGNAYMYVAKDGLGRPREIWPIVPKRVRVGRDPISKVKVYTVDGDMDVPYRDLSADGSGEVIHVPGFGLDGLTGLSVIAQARRALQLALAAEEYAARVFSEGSPPGGQITSTQTLTREQALKLRLEWDRQHKGLSKAQRVAVMDNGAKWEPTTLNLEDMQYLEARRFQVSEIARMFGIAPHLLADVEKSTSWGSGIEEQGRNTVTYTFGSYIRRFEDAFTYRVMARFAELYGRFNLNGLLRGDTLTRYRAYALGRQWGWLSVNDIRRLEDLSPIPEGGDEYLVPLNMQELGAALQSDIQAADLAKAGAERAIEATLA